MTSWIIVLFRVTCKINEIINVQKNVNGWHSLCFLFLFCNYIKCVYFTGNLKRHEVGRSNLSWKVLNLINCNNLWVSTERFFMSKKCFFFLYSIWTTKCELILYFKLFQLMIDKNQTVRDASSGYRLISFYSEQQYADLNKLLS